MRHPCSALYASSRGPAPGSCVVGSKRWLRLRMKWSVTYTKSGLPDLLISGVEVAVFEGDRIERLRDIFDPEAEKAMGQWMAQHGAALQG